MARPIHEYLYSLVVWSPQTFAHRIFWTWMRHSSVCGCLLCRWYCIVVVLLLYFNTYFAAYFVIFTYEMVPHWALLCSLHFLCHVDSAGSLARSVCLDTQMWKLASQHPRMLDIKKHQIDRLAMHRNFDHLTDKINRLELLFIGYRLTVNCEHP